MKIKKLLYPASLILILILVFGCQKDDDTAPAPPITAENTFSCYINGELFVPKNHGGFINQYGYTISILDDNSWIITLSDEEKTLYLFIKEVDRVGEYRVQKSDGDQFFVQDLNTSVELRDRVNDTEYLTLENAGTIQVLDFKVGESLLLKFDEIMLVQNENTEEKIILTEGKLNINKETLNKND